MNAAVTGASGFIGGHLVGALFRDGWTVRVLARSTAAGRALHARGCDVVQGDLDDERALSRLVSDADVVFHVAGLVAARSGADFHTINVSGTSALTRAAASESVPRFVYVSSLAATGPSRPGHPVGDESRPRPLTAYGRSKLAAEDVVRQSGVRFTIVRPPAVYGPGDRGLLPVFRLAVRGIMPVLDESQELSLVYATDLASALIAAATSTTCEGHVHHAAHPEIVTQRRLGDTIARAARRRVVRIRVPAALLRFALRGAAAIAQIRRRTLTVSPDKANEILAPAWTARADRLVEDTGWTAATALEDGIAITARWYREAGWL